MVWLAFGWPHPGLVSIGRLMGRFLVRRILHMSAVLVAVLVIVSLLLRLIPGDPVDAMMAANPGMTQETMDAVREQLGLTDPIHEQVL
ncbi:MAG: hypothetical protein IT339_07355, partial [Thermomicrobiales bacterium]|nr:hypothetical protein [Thermomicrobiales bacterium]